MTVKPSEMQNPGSAPVSGAGESVSLSRTSAYFYKRRLPHFEKPWAIYAITITTRGRRHLSSGARKIVLDAFLFFHTKRYDLFAISVMPDHVHALFQPLPRDDHDEKTFWAIAELMHSLKSFTAHSINKSERTIGQVWENETFDRYVRSDRDLEEKFHYILRNPWDAGIVKPNEPYEWIWTPDDEHRLESSSRRDAATSVRDARAPQSESVSREARALPRNCEQPT
jgi:REP element-mobilizing transposase RayT